MPARDASRLIWAGTILADVSSSLADLQSAIAGVQSLLNAIAAWVQSAAAVAHGPVVDAVAAAPGYLPEAAGLSELLGSVFDLPDDLRRSITDMLTQWENRTPGGALAAAHNSYVTATPVLTQDAGAIAMAAAVVAASDVRQHAGVEATAEAARAVVSDPSLTEAGAAAQQSGNTMMQEAPNLPSSRAGIEMLVAGMGFEMQQQAAAATSLGDRLTALAQQTAAMSQQIGALGEATEALTAQAAGQESESLNARLGLMDALHAGGQALTSMLADADESADAELQLTPLY